MIYFKPVTVNIKFFTVNPDDQKPTTFSYSFKMRPHNDTEYKKIYGNWTKKFKKLKLNLIVENKQQINEFVWILRAGAEGLHPITIFNCEIVRDDGVKQIFNAYIESYDFFDEILSNPLAEPMVEFIITKNPT